MANVYPVAGCKLYIGGVKNPTSADFAAADFTSVTWTLIDGWATMGAIGDAAALITTPLINRGRDVKQKGTANAGSMANSFTPIADDAGQLALIAAAAPAVKDNYAFKIEYNDKPATGVAPAASQALFSALVMSAQEAGGGANTARMLNSTLEINSNIVHVAATDGS